jgi:3-methyladenine DNA glycosylase AlkC
VTYSLKLFFDARVIGRIADELAAVHPTFPRRAFLKTASAGLDRLELMDRGRHIARALREHLPPDPEVAIGLLERSLGPVLEATEGHGMEPFTYLPHVLFVAEHGLACFDASMRAQHALTQRFSAEFSIRRFLEHATAPTLARLEAWTTDASPHVRRLVSEGTRPRLPWAGRLRAFQADPTPVLRLLERLKDDPHPYVRRSVANSLNDIGKDHPKVLVEVARRWLKDASPDRRRLVAHALRTAVKRGDPQALSALGFRGAGGARVARVTIAPPRPRIGEHVRVEVEVVHAGRRPVDLNLDFAIHFVKARGATSRKVFKLRTLHLEPGSKAVVSKRISLAQHTTRTHHRGRHAVDVVLNGTSEAAGAFHLQPARGSSTP